MVARITCRYFLPLYTRAIVLPTTDYRVHVLCPIAMHIAIAVAVALQRKIESRIKCKILGGA